MRLQHASRVVEGRGFQVQLARGGVEDDQPRIVVIQRAAHHFEHRRPQRARIELRHQRVVDVQQQFETVALAAGLASVPFDAVEVRGVLDRQRQLLRDLPQEENLGSRQRVRMGAADVQNAVRPASRLERQAHARLDASSHQGGRHLGVETLQRLPAYLNHVAALEREPRRLVPVEQLSLRDGLGRVRLHGGPSAQALGGIVPERKACVEMRDRPPEERRNGFQQIGKMPLRRHGVGQTQEQSRPVVRVRRQRTLVLAFRRWQAFGCTCDGSADSTQHGHDVDRIVGHVATGNSQHPPLSSRRRGGYHAHHAKAQSIREDGQGRRRLVAQAHDDRLLRQDGAACRTEVHGDFRKVQAGERQRLEHARPQHLIGRVVLPDGHRVERHDLADVRGNAIEERRARLTVRHVLDTLEQQLIGRQPLAAGVRLVERRHERPRSLMFRRGSWPVKAIVDARACRLRPTAPRRP